MKESGKSVSKIVTATGCSRNVVTPLWNKWIKSRSINKEDAIITVRPRCIKEGDGRTLTTKQEKEIQRVIKDKYPEQLKFDYALWTREAVVKLISQKYNITMPIRTVGEYLERHIQE
jgi:transposase